MLKQAVIGDKWGTLTCIDAGFEDREIDEGGGTYRTLKVYVYRLKCECGKTKTVLRSEFQGKRVVKDCGCGSASGGHSTPLNITVPSELRERLIEEKLKHKVTLSHMVVMLIEAGLNQGTNGKGNAALDI